MPIILPRIYAVDEERLRNPIRQIALREQPGEGILVRYSRGRFRGHIIQLSTGDEILVASDARRLPSDTRHALQANIDEASRELTSSAAKWLRHPLYRQNEQRDRSELVAEVRSSWRRAFKYITEDEAKGTVGLRAPQIGALHALHAHWSVSKEAATVVLPTGTGKTDTMIAAMVSAECHTLLIVVPTDALRSQLTEKFLTLGVLKDPQSVLLAEGALYPLVCTLRHVPKSVADVELVFGATQVIVATSSLLAQCSEAVQKAVADHCSHLFIDEAHHAEAPTWRTFRGRFDGKYIAQFTATPFREDGARIDGRIVFRYSLRQAQEAGFFKQILFTPVIEFDPDLADLAIATEAIARLKADLHRGHILMARAGTVRRAKEIFEIYKAFPQYNPVELHTGVAPTPRKAAREQVISGHSRIVVCVDMLGEGFDLPELKIAAFHDIRKSLAVTLQLAGRFTRMRPDLGDAVFVANIADVQVQEELRALYARDPDWNALLPQIADSMVGSQQSLQEFVDGFASPTGDIPLASMRPALSTVVYRSQAGDWRPENYPAGIQALGRYEQIHHAINHEESTLVVLLGRQEPLPWTDAELLLRWSWELIIAYWNRAHQLLFINASENAGDYRQLAGALVGSAALIDGETVFRSFAGVNRLRLQNVGLTEQLGRNVRFTGRMGSDVEPMVPEAHRNRTRKSVLSGTGYEIGRLVSVGASRRGRIWAHRRERIPEFVEWCRSVGEKLLDDNIDPDALLRGTLAAQTVAVAPPKTPIAVDWPETVYAVPEISWVLTVDGDEFSLLEVDIELVSATSSGMLGLLISAEGKRAEFELELFDNGGSADFAFRPRLGAAVSIRRQGSHRSASLEQFFYQHPPIFWFHDGSSLEGNQLVELKAAYPGFDVAKIDVWDWTGIDIRKESQGQEKSPDSVQAKVILELCGRGNYEVVFDDDGKGEAADVIGIRMIGKDPQSIRIDVEFYHCKYSSSATPGTRVKDLYELCGQAQKCIHWMASPVKLVELFTHMLRRESMRLKSGGPSRFEFGDADRLGVIREMSRICPVTLQVFVVQPGMSKAGASRDQLILLSVVEHYLLETYQLPFAVIASP
jgi:superfamily II DNA or RNA helicase